MKKKTAAGILSLMMAGALISGCGQSSTGSDTSSTDAVTASTEAEEESAAASTEAEEASSEASTEAESSSADLASWSEDFSYDKVCELFPEAEKLIETNFLEERAGKSEFESYDEIISLLENGEGYAYIKLDGYDGDVLAITDMLYAWDEDTSAAISVSLYTPCGYIEGNPIYDIGDVQTGGTAYPIRLSEDGTLYVCNNRTFSKLKVSEQGLLYYAEKTNIVYSEDGTATVMGFTAEDGNIVDAQPKTDVTTEDEFNALFDNLDEIPVIAFTKVVK